MIMNKENKKLARNRKKRIEQKDKMKDKMKIIFKKDKTKKKKNKDFKKNKQLELQLGKIKYNIIPILIESKLKELNKTFVFDKV